MSDDLQDWAALVLADIAEAEDESALQVLTSKLLGKGGRIAERRRALKDLPKVERPQAGALVHALSQQLQAAVQVRRDVLERVRIEAALAGDCVDVSLPGRRDASGSLHPVTRTLRQIEDIFLAVGFSRAEGPEIEDDYHNFGALNTPLHHPARAMQDTFYIQPQSASSPTGSAPPLPLLLRTHTSAVQVRTMENQSPPLRIICPGRVYRADHPDATHTPMFHQVEGLVVDEGISMGHLKSTVLEFLQAFFGADVSARFRPSYFPFTEPSVEVDVECIHCRGDGCATCSQTGWIEVIGCGMVHPKVLQTSGVDPERYSGFAFGFGADRLCALQYGIHDLRLFFDNDVRFLRQFA